jgi:hypothetical protein
MPEECKRVSLRRQVYAGGKRNVKGQVSEDRCIWDAGRRPEVTGKAVS